MPTGELDLQQVEVLRLEPGDILVYRYPNRLSPQVIEFLRKKLKEYFPDHEVMVLEEGSRFQVVRAGEAVD